MNYLRDCNSEKMQVSKTHWKIGSRSTYKKEAWEANSAFCLFEGNELWMFLWCYKLHHSTENVEGFCHCCGCHRLATDVWLTKFFWFLWPFELGFSPNAGWVGSLMELRGRLRHSLFVSVTRVHMHWTHWVGDTFWTFQWYLMPVMACNLGKTLREQLS